MNFRRAMKSDLNAIAAFHWHSAHARLKKIEGSIADGQCFVADCAGRLAGCGTISYNFFERGFLDLLYIHTTDRRRKLGTGLLQCIKSACTTATIFTSTNLSNLPTQGLLAKNGYQSRALSKVWMKPIRSCSTASACDCPRNSDAVFWFDNCRAQEDSGGHELSLKSFCYGLCIGTRGLNL
jgi:N-acetylglutamate synthase-like GNAT family acetyltransferase